MDMLAALDGLITQIRLTPLNAVGAHELLIERTAMAHGYLRACRDASLVSFEVDQRMFSQIEATRDSLMALIPPHRRIG